MIIVRSGLGPNIMNLTTNGYQKFDIHNYDFFHLIHFHMIVYIDT